MSNPEDYPSDPDEDPTASTDPHLQDPAFAAKARRDRLEQNRISARESRKRKKTMIEELQRTVITLSKENKELNERNEFLRRELVEIGTKHPGLVPIQALMRGGALAAAGAAEENPEHGVDPTENSAGAVQDANPQAAVAVQQQPQLMAMPQAAAAPNQQQQMALMQQMVQMQAAAGMLGQQNPAMMGLNPAFMGMMGMAGMPQQQQPQMGVPQGMPQQQQQGMMGQQEGQGVQQQQGMMGQQERQGVQQQQQGMMGQQERQGVQQQQQGMMGQQERQGVQQQGMMGQQERQGVQQWQQVQGQGEIKTE